jgi:hypothetical protein
LIVQLLRIDEQASVDPVLRVWLEGGTDISDAHAASKLLAGLLRMLNQLVSNDANTMGLDWTEPWKLEGATSVQDLD